MAIEKKIVALFLAVFLMAIKKNNGLVTAVKLRLSNDSISSSVTAMYVFGDSSVDCGDNTPFYSIFHRSFSLYPCNGSDSSLVPQLLAKKMGLQRVIPFYSQNGSIHEILGGVNFGAAQATILSPGTQNYQSLNQQLRQAYETIQLLQLHLGEEIVNHYINSSIFYLSFGKDDFINYFVNNSSNVKHNYNGKKFSHILVRQMTDTIRNLYAINVRKIIVAGVLPLGCAPHLLLKWDRSVNSTEVKGCFDEVNLLVLEYNTKLEEKIVDINKELPDLHIVFCDVYRAMMEFINNSTAYGFEDAKNACCGVGRYGGLSGCITPDMACAQPSTRVWWDFYNPTPVVNSFLADSAWSGKPLSAICRPITVQELLNFS